MSPRRQTSVRSDITASGAWSQMVVRGLEGLDVDVHELCEALDVPYASLVDADARVPVDVLSLLWSEAARSSGDPCLGLHAAQQQQPRLNHVHSHVILSGRNLRDGILALRSTLPVLAQSAEIELEDCGDHFVYRFVHARGDLPPGRHAVEFTTATLQRLFGLVHDAPLPLRRVTFAHPHPGVAHEHERVFGCPVRFAQPANEMWVDREVMLKPSCHHSAELLRRFQDVAEHQLTRLSAPSFAAELRSLLRSRLRQGAIQADDIAAELHIGCRTFQRRLEAEATSFREVLDDVRREVALELLKSDLPLRDVAERCGFSGSGTLIRAFRRWTGTTPAAYRAAIRPSAP